MADNYREIPNMRRGASALVQYTAVRLGTTAFRVVPMSDANAQRPIGILQDDPESTDEPCAVAYDGVCLAQAGGIWAVGDALAVANDGQLIVDVEVADGGAIDLHHVATALEIASDG